MKVYKSLSIFNLLIISFILLFKYSVQYIQHFNENISPDISLSISFNKMYMA
jgi:hypothetical protein